MSWNGFKDWMMLGLLSAGVVIFWDLNRGVQTLNTTMAVITEKVVTHEKRIDKHESEIDKLKTNPRGH